MFDADRQPYCRFKNADPFPNVFGYARMGHGGRMASQRFRAAKANGKLKYLKGIQERERRGLATANVERERRSGTRALHPEYACGRSVVAEERQIGHACDLRVVGQEFGDDAGMALAFSMRMLSVSSERPSIQHECGSSCVPIAP